MSGPRLLLDEERVCGGCDHKIPWDWVFCSWCGFENDAPEPHAKARLIAAAPELLDAANAVLTYFMPSFPDSRAVDDCLVQLAAAVTKAEIQR